MNFFFRFGQILFNLLFSKKVWKKSSILVAKICTNPDCHAGEHVKCLRTRSAKLRLDALKRNCLLAVYFFVGAWYKKEGLNYVTNNHKAIHSENLRSPSCL